MGADDRPSADGRAVRRVKFRSDLHQFIVAEGQRGTLAPQDVIAELMNAAEEMMYVFKEAVDEAVTEAEAAASAIGSPRAH